MDYDADTQLEIIRPENRKHPAIRIGWGEAKIYIPKGTNKRLAKRLIKRAQKIAEAELNKDIVAIRAARRLSPYTIYKGQIVTELLPRKRVETELKEKFKSILAKYSEKYPFLTYKTVEVKVMPTSWARRRRDGTISIDIRAAALPPHALEYLAVHELIHTVTRGHGSTFRALIHGIYGKTEYVEQLLRIYWYYTRLNKEWNNILQPVS